MVLFPLSAKILKKALSSLSKAEDALNSGVSLLISPEGTRTLTGEMSPFKKGPFHLAKKYRRNYYTGWNHWGL